MRVLLVANTLPPADISGVGEQVLQLEAALQARGHDVRVLGRGERGAPGPKLLFPVAVLPATWRALRDFGPDVVQVHESDGALAALLVAILGRALPVPPRIFALLQVSYVEEFRAIRAVRWGGRVLGRPVASELVFKWLRAPLHVVLGCLASWVSDCVLAPSATTASELERDYGAEDVRVLPNVTGGVAVEAAAAPEIEEEGYLLFLGRLRLRKGVEVLLEALSEVPGRLGPRLLVAGDGENRGRLEARSRELGVSKRVRFLGRQGSAEVRALLSRARALVVPSLYEGMPLVVLEAMEAGVPVIASRVSGMPEVVVHGSTGWLVPPEDPPALAAALIEVLSHPDAAAAAGEAGRQRLDRLYRPEHAASRWLELAMAEKGDDR